MTNFYKKVTIKLGDKVKRESKRKVFVVTKKRTIYFMFFIILICILLVFCNIYFTKNETYAVSKINNSEIKIARVKDINIDEIIEKNIEKTKKEEYREEIEELEYLTEYVADDNLPQGEVALFQEGSNGTQKITYKKVFEDENLIGEEKISAKVQKPAFNKIVHIGKNKQMKSYIAKPGELVTVMSDELTVYLEPNEKSNKTAKLVKNEKVKILKIDKEWYYIENKEIRGWIKKEGTRYIVKEVSETSKNSNYSNGNINKNIDFNMNLNKPSGLSLEQFEKILDDKKDVNNVFKENAKYFYYIEKQYNINGIFVASIGIHESNWGTSKISRDKKNLFGYGAYDSNPYNGAYNFSNYSESIDLIARVLVKYYLNPKGTKIYEGETAKGTYYYSPTLSGVNKKYASDKNWANCVYKHMKYLYQKI